MKSHYSFFIWNRRGTKPKENYSKWDLGKETPRLSSSRKVLIPSGCCGDLFRFTGSDDHAKLDKASATLLPSQ
ncbi:hypothetical protein Sjap_014643 [Stephania japonica]|uniref:Uncharacterized protein n=1 Tax=Stephania japonica TaxID=461633 RepID=A0AAP0IJ50_9MAGN